ncbi:hypothetical protein BO94DRAFT_306771 [Aspergillus sclerotioniger CBS 115572]|uniref:Uncharacterized protein n=1 Tax=Aspergillus sclerotioniger CBS 115572 TaxID=1450535 RepID=A0A317UZW6_9EURO|nr:hypothetical protein BO94DRAFT_306771 [Aspergillus sclerotioniger CBS 115572]PWY67603.1 hypothetical protein BO94DRAFT_306771 [Aspergillus sclerotioniger CBS 115572]
MVPPPRSVLLESCLPFDIIALRVIILCIGTFPFPDFGSNRTGNQLTEYTLLPIPSHLFGHLCPVAVRPTCVIAVKPVRIMNLASTHRGTTQTPGVRIFPVPGAPSTRTVPHVKPIISDQDVDGYLCTSDRQGSVTISSHTSGASMSHPL